MTKGELQPNVSHFDALSSFPVRFWVYIVVTGVGAGIGGGLLMRLLYAIQQTTWSYSSGSFLDGVEHSPPWWRVVALALAGVLVGVGRWSLKWLTGKQGGEVAGAIWLRSGEVQPVPTLGNALLSICAVGMGASIGREGAIKDMGAVVASQLAGHSRLAPAHRRLLVACGVGAGAAVAYNVPLGGALFAVEVLLGELSLPLVIPALATSGIATAVSWSLLPNRPTYIIPEYDCTISLMIWALLAGPVLGVCSAAYVGLIGWANARKPTGWRMIAAPIVGLTLLGVAAMAFPKLLGNGKGLVQLAFIGELTVAMFILLPALKVLSTALCLGCGTPGGLFTPTMTLGALLGGLLGHAWSCLWPGTPVGAYALIGSGAVLAAASHGPVSSIVFLIELTWRLDPIVTALMVAVAGATLVARRLDSRSIYTTRIRSSEEDAVRDREGK